MWEISKKSTSKDATAQVGDSILINNLIENMPVKFTWSALFSSKTVWLNVIITIIGLATYLQSVASFDKYAVVLGIILTFGNLILKIWFNDTAIASSPKVL